MAVDIIRDQLADVKALAERKDRDLPRHVFPGPGARAAVTGAGIAKAIKREEITNRGRTSIMGIEPWTAHDLRRSSQSR
jgi:hypothetical protein